MNEWVKKMLYVHNRVLFAHKKRRRNLSFETLDEHGGHMLSKSDKERQIRLCFSYGEILKQKTKKTKVINTERVVAARGRGWVKRSEEGQKVQSSSYKIHKSLMIYNMETMVNDDVLCI